MGSQTYFYIAEGNQSRRPRCIRQHKTVNAGILYFYDHNPKSLIFVLALTPSSYFLRVVCHLNGIIFFEANVQVVENHCCWDLLSIISGYR